MYFPVLLCTCILSMLGLTDAIPVHQVKLQADTIIHRITEHKKELNLSPKIHIVGPELYPEDPADKPIQGLGSIVDTLTNFQKVLHTLPRGHVSQLRIEVSSLLGYFKERMKLMHCTPKEPANGSPVNTFTDKYHVTFGYLALDRLKQFMQKLKVNLDQLKSC